MKVWKGKKEMKHSDTCYFSGCHSCRVNYHVVIKVFWVLKSSFLCCCLFYHWYFDSCCICARLSSSSCKVCRSFRKFCSSALLKCWNMVACFHLFPAEWFLCFCSCSSGDSHWKQGLLAVCRVIERSLLFRGILLHILVFSFFGAVIGSEVTC